MRFALGRVKGFTKQAGISNPQSRNPNKQSNRVRRRPCQGRVLRMKQNKLDKLITIVVMAGLAQLLGSILFPTAFASSSSRVTAVGEVREHRVAHTATPLLDGKVFVCGGANESGTLASCELFDPVAGTFSVTGSLHVPRQGHTATRLPDGRVLIAGGNNDGELLSSVEIYDPATGQSYLMGSMISSRSGHSATVLSDGLILFAGGNGAGTAELFEPTTKVFIPLINRLTAVRSRHSATLLSDGLVSLSG